VSGRPLAAAFAAALLFAGAAQAQAVVADLPTPLGTERAASDPYEALSPHGCLGIEGSVIQRIAAWINAAPGR
jgi:hypothetical protein